MRKGQDDKRKAKPAPVRTKRSTYFRTSKRKRPGREGLGLMYVTPGGVQAFEIS